MPCTYPNGNEWCINNDKLNVLWMICNPAPDEVGQKKVDEIV